MLTRGPRPALVATAKEVWEATPEALEPLNTTGCGDAFTAALAHALALGQDLRAAVEAGHRAGASTPGSSAPGSSSEPGAGAHWQRPVAGSIQKSQAQVPSGLQLPAIELLAGSALQVWSAPGSHTGPMTATQLPSTQSAAYSGGIWQAQSVARARAAAAELGREIRAQAVGDHPAGSGAVLATAGPAAKAQSAAASHSATRRSCKSRTVHCPSTQAPYRYFMICSLGAASMRRRPRSRNR
ncbi:MAG: PfkB family carbohydrate kinase [Sphingobacterium sp.]|nr:PfkB family carbohydrate kinase [Sphingobacterium sp.]